MAGAIANQSETVRGAIGRRYCCCGQLNQANSGQCVPGPADDGMRQRRAT